MNPSSTDDELVNEIQKDIKFGILQMFICIGILVMAGLLLSVSMRFHNLAAILMLSGQILDIPFRPLMAQ